MKIEDIQIRNVKYRISKFDVIVPGYPEPYSIDQAHMGNFVIEKDYQDYVFPYMEFRIIVPDQVYRDMCKEPENVFVDLKLEYAYFDDFYEMEPGDALRSDGVVFDNRFYAYLTNMSPKLTDAVLGEKNKEKYNGGDLTQYSFDNDHEVILMLYRADHIFNTDQVINKVLQNVTMADCIAYYFKQMGLGNLLMSPPQNTRLYKQIILPPVPVIGGMMRMCATYGIHKLGTLIFFDYDRCYFIDRKVGATAWSNNEIYTVYLTSFPQTVGDDGIMKSGFYVNQKEKYCVINVLGDQISITNESMYGDTLLGSNVVLIDSTQGTTESIHANVKVNQMSPSARGAINSVLVMDSGVSQLPAYKADLEYSKKCMSLVMHETSITALCPNRDYILTTDNDKYKDSTGHYKLMKHGTVFTKESEYYTSITTASFVGGVQIT